ncbi:MAG: hypothetical protein KAZ94_04015 [Burkholderiales bacterium]|jgi:hypothetical protein|nr:hypothetical protein [Burkholderiales bacterium]
MIELPEINRSFIFHTGQIVQIPSNMIHRVSHYSKTNQQSRYILIQIGKFSIDFIKDDRITISENYVDIKDKKINYYIGSHQENIKTILLYFIENRPTNLSNAEYINILEALNVVYKDAVLQMPTNDILLQQLKDI